MFIITFRSIETQPFRSASASHVNEPATTYYADRWLTGNFYRIFLAHPIQRIILEHAFHSFNRMSS